MAGDIEQWLEGLGLGKYAGVFAENDVDFRALPHLDRDDLKELGVSLGHRKVILAAIEAMNDARETAEAVPPRSSPAANAAASTGEAERRQLTVMFCDLVGSTALSTKLDPEDLREVIRAYQNTCAKVIAEYDGYIAKYMGDGILVYFGYPQAHENDAERAARAGLDLVAAVAELGPAQTALPKADLAVRVGIDTGLVVVGGIVGEDAAEEAGVVGETPNVAARLQALARPNEVVIGALTRDLVGDVVAFDDLGEHRLKGIAEAVHAWRVRRQDVAEERDAGKWIGGGLPLVGRREELGLLVRSWEASKERHGQAVLIQGEAGIGKSRLLEALRDHVSGEAHTWVAHRCSPYHANSTLYPIIEHLKRVMVWKPEDSAGERFDKLEAALGSQSLPLEEAVPLYAELMAVPVPDDRYQAVALSAEQKREQTLDALAGWLLEETERSPVLQVWEDLHWADPTTLELLGLYIEQSPTVSMLNVLTYRPEFVPPWSMRSHMTPITLNRLERPEAEALIGHQAGGKQVPSEVVRHVVDKADGVPLYVEELTKTILNSDFLNEELDRYTLAGSLSEVAIPASLQDSLMARLDRLPSLREVAQMGAVLGREFAYEMLRGMTGLEEPQLQNGLEQLVADELLYQRGRGQRSKYIFKHALIQDAAYQSLLKRTRQRCHQRVAELLEEQFDETVEAHPELVAHHYTEAGEAERAVHYWREAGERARARSANLEAIAYLEKGIEILRELADSESHARQELALQVSLGHANIVSKGHGAAGAEAAYARALALCEQLGDVPELLSTLFGLWRFYVVARPLDGTNDVAMQLRRLAEEAQEIERHVVAYYALGYTALCLGNLADARDNLREGIARYLPGQRTVEIYRAAQDPGVACRAYLAMTEWLLGFPERAQARARESVALAEELDDPFSLAYALCFPGAIVSEMCGGDTGTVVERGLEVAADGEFSLWVAFAKVHRASLRFEDQRSDAALDELRHSVVAIPEIGVLINSPYYMTLLARAHWQAGRSEAGLQVLDEAQQSLEARGERWWEAEVLRLRGELLLSRSATNGNDAQACFEQALAVSRNQEAKSLELRAAMSLTRSWQSQAKAGEAHDLLAPIYGWFTEGFDTADLKDAKALLDELV
jgi:predicted ATPase/class 3 adenylate cyclase